MRIYLAGPHMDDAYRSEAKFHLRGHDLDVFDPIAARDFRGKEIDNENVIVEGDLDDVASSDLILGNYSAPGWGTGMETWYAFSKGIQIVAYVTLEARVSPWIAYVAGGYDNVHRDLRAACAHVVSLARALPPRYA